MEQQLITRLVVAVTECMTAGYAVFNTLVGEAVVYNVDIEPNIGLTIKLMHKGRYKVVRLNTLTESFVVMEAPLHPGRFVPKRLMSLPLLDETKRFVRLAKYIARINKTRQRAKDLQEAMDNLGKAAASAGTAFAGIIKEIKASKCR